MAKRAAPFILLNGKRPDFQMGLFDFSPQSDQPWVPGGEPLLPLTMPKLERLGVESAVRDLAIPRLEYAEMEGGV